MDRRLTPANGEVALDVLRGQVAARRFVPGERARIAAPVVDLCRAPGGARDRQLVWGEALTVIDRAAGWAFVQAAKDGYCGHVREMAIGPPRDATHRVTAPASHLYPEPRIQAHELHALTFGSLLTVSGRTDRFAETPDGFVPMMHLRPLAERCADPVSVAEMFIGTPYLWGGNSHAGIDCSGLVQMSLLAAGIDCPGDTDLQAQSAGVMLDDRRTLARGDLIFWKGHVAMITDAQRLIHATGHVMAVVVEEIDTAIARIAASGLAVLARRRPAP